MVKKIVGNKEDILKRRTQKEKRGEFLKDIEETLSSKGTVDILRFLLEELKMKQ